MKEKTFAINEVRDIANYVKNSLSEIPIIIIGERHHNRTDHILQREVMEVIRNLKPKFFLYELLHSAIYEPFGHKLIFRNDKEKEYPENSDEFETWEEGFYFNIAKEYNVKIIGCDLPSCKQQDLSQNFYLDPNMIIQERENKMGEIIAEYLTEDSKSSEPLIVVLGNRHVKKTSKIYNFIKSGYISICIDDICDKCNGEIKDKDQNVDQCQNCNAFRPIKIKTKLRHIFKK